MYVKENNNIVNPSYLLVPCGFNQSWIENIWRKKVVTTHTKAVSVLNMQTYYSLNNEV